MSMQRACDRCAQGVMDADGPQGPGNDHLYGRCICACHEPSPERLVAHCPTHGLLYDPRCSYCRAYAS